MVVDQITVVRGRGGSTGGVNFPSDLWPRWLHDRLDSRSPQPSRQTSFAKQGGAPAFHTAAATSWTTSEELVEVEGSSKASRFGSGCPERPSQLMTEPDAQIWAGLCFLNWSGF